MEIESKHLVEKIPEEFLQCPQVEIEQGYLSEDPTLRIRRWDETYVFTIKNHVEVKAKEARVSEEYEIAISKDCFDKFKGQVKGNLIQKTRYKVPYEGYVIEVDVFHGKLDGLILAEVEINSLDEFVKIPDWVGEEVSHNPRYFNSNLALAD